MNKFNSLMKACGVFLLWGTTAVALPAQTFTTVYIFDGTNGGTPVAALVQGTNGNLFGTTYYGGNSMCPLGCGTVFEVMPNGALTTLYSFCSQLNCPDGSNPYAGLVQASNGDFYGTTYKGGANGDGTVFKITPSGMLTTLHSFDLTDGELPQAGLIQAANGDFYGTTSSGGLKSDGTVFKITPSGTLTTLHSFCSQLNCDDGYYPEAALVQATDGNLYGTADGGGANNKGTIFKISPSGALTTLYSFCSQSNCADGSGPSAGLIQATNGDFYGITTAGGGKGFGTVFEITPNGALTILHSFDLVDGESPRASLVLGTDGNFYGTTPGGGAGSSGTIFSITPSGTLTTLYSFCLQYGCADGNDPSAGLVQATNGRFYGTTAEGGVLYSGTAFSLSVDLGPFVETQPAAGSVGTAVNILGTNLTGSTKVTFHGTAATFTVKSKSEITTTVPVGATTGIVKVVTDGSTLSSNGPFRVTP